MIEKRHRPTGLWFWGVVALANVYLAVGLFLPAFWGPEGLVGDVFMVAYSPMSILLEVFVDPFTESLHAGRAWAPAVTLAFSELVAVLVGLVVYGCACLIHALAPGDGARKDGGRGKGDD